MSVHPLMKHIHYAVFNSGMRNFSQGQGNQGIIRRRTNEGTPHKQSRRLTQRLRKRAISGWKLMSFQDIIARRRTRC